MNAWLQETFRSTPEIAYSKCAAQPGWNVKYRKGGRSLCTLYPMSGYFIALVVVGSKEMTEAGLLIPSCCAYTQNLFEATRFSCGGKWMMLDVNNPEVLEDVKN